MASSKQMAAAWVAQTGKTKNASSGSYSGPCLYSYRTMIGRLVETPKGGMVALFTTSKFSTTTSGFQSICREEAQIAGLACFTVDHVDASTPAAHIANHHAILALAKAARARAVAPKVRIPEGHIREAERHEARAAAYAETFGIGG